MYMSIYIYTFIRHIYLRVFQNFCATLLATRALMPQFMGEMCDVIREKWADICKNTQNTKDSR